MAISVAYISGVFLAADSTVVSDMGPYNPYSLLHIPLYGFLALFLILSFLPFNVFHFKKGTETIDKNLRKPDRSNGLVGLLDPSGKINPTPRLLMAGFIATSVAIADELHQSLIPSRHASMMDVFLDMVGICVVIFFAHQLCRDRH